MQELKKIWAFGIPYLRPYWPRFLLGIALGIFFGLSNGLFVLSVNALFSRLTPPKPIESRSIVQRAGPDKKGRTPLVERLPDQVQPLAKKAEQVADEWLPTIGQPVSWRQALGGFFLLPLVMGARAMASYFSSYLLTWVSARVIRDMQLAALRKAQQLSMAFFQKRPVADLAARITGDTKVIYDSMTNGFIDTIREPFALGSIVISMLVIDWKLTLISMGMLPLVAGPVIMAGRRLRGLTRRHAGLNVTVAGGLLEALSAMRIVKAYSMEKRQLESYRGHADAGVMMAVKTSQTRNLLNPVIEILAMLGIGFLILFVFYSGSKPANLVTFLAALLLAPQSIKRIANLHLTLQAASVSIERLEELFAERPSVPEPAHAHPLKKFQQRLSMQGVSFGYGGTEVLHDIYLEIPKGKKVGLAGHSGSGKSTLINLIMRFYDPTRGTVLLDGHNLRDYATKDLLSQMALVSQDVVLFDVSVGNNIAFGHEGATQAEIELAAKRANAHEFIMKMPQGYDSPCGEHGQLLSGGQKARVAIARAFVRNAPILVLDEPTAALDSKAEAEIQKAIDSLEEGRTVICIAHRLSTLANMDEIIVLDHGRIVERGTFEELLRAKGHFAKMAEQQRLTASA